VRKRQTKRNVNSYLSGVFQIESDISVEKSDPLDGTQKEVTSAIKGKQDKMFK